MTSTSIETAQDRPGAMSIEDWRRAYGVGKSTFYLWEKLGRTPETLKVGRRRLITFAADAAWRQRMQAETAARKVAAGA